MITDTDTLNLTEAARAMKVSRSTIYNWIGLGYEPEYGRRTTLAHLKNWLRQIYRPVSAANRKAKRVAMQAMLDRLV